MARRKTKKIVRAKRTVKSRARKTRSKIRRAKRPKPNLKKPTIRRAKIKVSRKLANRAAKSKEKHYVGKISHYFTRIGVGVVEVEKPVRKGEWLKIEGFTTNMRQKANSIQHNRRDIKLANRGKSIGLKVNDRVRENDKVYVFR
ncbi:MAG: hypothetical protein ISS36_00795 [Candidatus Aenigmarchaeota archaeon]|nr:hypothetical protein [Candidatus Aenigmarchaeota archaeon]